MGADVWALLLEGTVVTLKVTSLAVVLGTLLALIGGVTSLSQRRWVRWVTTVYVELFRGVAALILLFWVYYALPLAAGIVLSPLWAGVLALGTNMGAYGTEIARGAIAAVPEGQTEASIALNLTRWQQLRDVIIPQAVVAMLPPYGNLIIEVLKASALVSAITLSDIMRQAQNARVSPDVGASSVQIFAVALVLYFLISVAITGLVRVAERAASRGRLTAEGS